MVKIQVFSHYSLSSNRAWTDRLSRSTICSNHRYLVVEVDDRVVDKVVADMVVVQDMVVVLDTGLVLDKAAVDRAVHYTEEVGRHMVEHLEHTDLAVVGHKVLVEVVHNLVVGAHLDSYKPFSIGLSKKSGKVVNWYLLFYCGSFYSGNKQCSPY